MVGAPRQAVLAQYGACVGGARLPDLAAALFLVQASERGSVGGLRGCRGLRDDDERAY